MCDSSLAHMDNRNDKHRDPTVDGQLDNRDHHVGEGQLLI